MTIDIKYLNPFMLSTERAAYEAFLTKGKGNKIASDQAAVNAMRDFLNNLSINGTVIIGEGENYDSLKKMIIKYKMEKNIFLIGFKKNIYRYLKNCLALISVAEYEDPGFTLIEAAYLRKKIITSLVKNGPLEMQKNSDMCYFFQPNNENDFINQILNSEKDKNYNLKLINAQNFSRKFSAFSHYKVFKTLLR